MCSDDVYPYFIDPYCDSKYSGQNKASNNICDCSVIACVSEIDNWSDKEVFFNNWFSSLSLIKVLKDQGIRAAGTIGADRLGILKIDKSHVMKQERGTLNTFYKKNGIFFVTWNDNGPVTVISNINTDVPHASVKRWNPNTKVYIKLDRPHCITEYNKHMNGVDSLDAMGGIYRIDVLGKKWCEPHWGFQNVQIIQSGCKNGFLGFHMPYCNALSKIDQTIEQTINMQCFCLHYAQY